MKIFRLVILISVIFSLFSPLYAQGPESVVREFYNYVSTNNRVSAYALLSSEDKEYISKDEFEQSHSPFQFQSTSHRYMELFSIEIMDAVINGNKAYVKYKLIGPVNLYMRAWDETLNENQEKVKTVGNSSFNSPSELLTLIEERITELIVTENYRVEEQVRKVELFNEINEWRVHLNFRSQKQLQASIKMISEVDTELGYTEYGEINLDDFSSDERLHMYTKAMGKYKISKDVMVSLFFVLEEDIKNQNRLLDMIQVKIDKLTKKINEESENQKTESES